MRSKWFGLFSIILALMLLAGPLAGSAMAAADSSDPHAGHNTSAVNSSEQQMNEHDMSNMESTNKNATSHDASGAANEHDAASANGHSSIGNGSHDFTGSGSGSHDSSSGSSHDSGGDSHEASGGHGESTGDPNAPPNWPVIYGFGAFNLLVIIAAAFMKNKGVNGVN